jgi:hypothetical protein
VDKNKIYHLGHDRKKKNKVMQIQQAENRVRWLAFVKGRTVGSIKAGILMASDLLLSAVEQFAATPSFTLVFSNLCPNNFGVL